MPVSLAAGAVAGISGSIVPIASFVSDGTSSGTTFTNIPQIYQDLMITCNGRARRAVVSENLLISVNGDNTALYSHTYIYSIGTGQATTRGTGQGYAFNFFSLTGASANQGIFGSGITHILNYRDTSTFKTFLGTGASDANGDGVIGLSASLYRSTNAITSVSVVTYENFFPGSVISLYGIRSI